MLLRCLHLTSAPPYKSWPPRKMPQLYSELRTGWTCQNHWNFLDLEEFLSLNSIYPSALNQPALVDLKPPKHTDVPPCHWNFLDLGNFLRSLTQKLEKPSTLRKFFEKNFPTLRRFSRSRIKFSKWLVEVVAEKDTIENLMTS